MSTTSPKVYCVNNEVILPPNLRGEDAHMIEGTLQYTRKPYTAAAYWAQVEYPSPHARGRAAVAHTDGTFALWSFGNGNDIYTRHNVTREQLKTITDPAWLVLVNKIIDSNLYSTRLLAFKRPR